MPPSRRYPRPAGTFGEASGANRSIWHRLGPGGRRGVLQRSDPTRVKRRPGAIDRVDACRAAGWLSEADGLGRTALGRYRGTAGTAPERRTICRSVNRRTATFACLGQRPLCESAADAGGPGA